MKREPGTVFTRRSSTNYSCTATPECTHDAHLEVHTQGEYGWAGQAACWTEGHLELAKQHEQDNNASPTSPD